MFKRSVIDLLTEDAQALIEDALVNDVKEVLIEYDQCDMAALESNGADVKYLHHGHNDYILVGLDETPKKSNAKAIDAKTALAKAMEVTKEGMSSIFDDINEAAEQGKAKALTGPTTIEQREVLRSMGYQICFSSDIETTILFYQTT